MLEDNKKLAEVFREMGAIYSLKGTRQRFRAKAYSEAADLIESLPAPLGSYVATGEISDLPGIGTSLSQKILEYVRTGKVCLHDRLVSEFPPAYREMIGLPSMGLRVAQKLKREFNIADTAGLRAFLHDAGKTKLRGITEERLNRIRKALNMRSSVENRISLGQALFLADRWATIIRGIPGVLAVVPSGSLRRNKPSIGDIDLVVSAEAGNHKAIVETLAANEQVGRVLVKGRFRFTCTDRDNKVQIDVLLTEPSSFGAAQLYFTGSRTHTIFLRTLAKRKGLRLNQYGLFKATGEKLAGKSESDIYSQLGFEFIEPGQRENNRFLKAKAQHRAVEQKGRVVQNA